MEAITLFKGGILGLARTLALEVAHENIRVNTVSWDHWILRSPGVYRPQTSKRKRPKSRWVG
jgi:NAD(P)-dependent dehydrogenase (short-subunit alcohol dehydrogenase family)